MARANDRRHRVQEAIAAKEAANPYFRQDAMKTVRGIFKLFAGLFLALVWIVGLPGRIGRWFNKFKQRRAAHA